MWCDHCRRDSSTKILAETGQSVCAICGGDLDASRRTATEKARAFLDRWSNEEPAQPRHNAPDDRTREDRSRASTLKLPNRASEPLSAPRERIPLAKPVSADREPPPPTRPVAPYQSYETPSPPAPGTSISGSRDEGPTTTENQDEDMTASRKANRGPASDWPDPAVQVTSSSWSPSKPRRRTTIGQFFGQILAYAGILALTGGCAMVIWGYFGGPEGYAPTGWLIATGGQMMLLLGIATLVSEGLEQSALEVRAQVKLLDQRLERIERNAARSAIESRIRATPPRERSRLHQEPAVA